MPLTENLKIVAPNPQDPTWSECVLAQLTPQQVASGNYRVMTKDGVTVYVGGNPCYWAILDEPRAAASRKTSGYIKKSTFDALNVTTVSIPATFAGLESEAISPRLTYQLFRIYEVEENEDYVEVKARHVWYDNLKNYTLWEVPKANQDTDYTAAAVCRNILSNALSYTPSRVASDCTDTKKGSEFDYKQKNLVEAFLDPDKGVCAKFGLSLLRDNWDFYCLKEVGYNRGFIVENGKNLLGVERTESIENLVTRCAPVGKDSKGNIVWLDYQSKKYVDSQYIGDYACPFVEIYDTGLQIGKDGVTSQNIQEKLLEAGQKRFTDDHVDVPEVEMTIEFLSLGDTEEYAQYRGLDKVYLYDILTIHDTVRGYNYTAQVVGVEHDILTGMLVSVTIGKLNNWDGTRKIATWQVPEVNGENIRLQSIMEGSFKPGAIYEDDLANGIITADKISVTSIEAINAKLGTATIENGYINNAVIEYAKIKAATAESLIAHDAVTDRYYIDKLSVNNAQMVSATVGELIVKATDNHYYRLDIGANGALSPTDVTSTLSNGEITAGVTSDGKSTIIETDLTVQELSASNMKAINALIDKLTASRIDVDELFARTAVINKLSASEISSMSALGLTSAGMEIASSKYLKIKSGGVLTIDSGNFSIDSSGNVTMTGTVTAGAGSTIGGWTLGANRISSGSSTGYVAMDSDTSNTYAIWAGAETASSAPFRVKRNGEVTLTKLLALGEDGTTETEVNLRTANLWKLNYRTVTGYTNSNGYCTSMTLTGGVTLNFRSAASGVLLTGAWSGNTYTVTETYSGEDYSVSFSGSKNTGTNQNATFNVNSFDTNHKAWFLVSCSPLTWYMGCNVDATSEYNGGWTDCYGTVGLDSTTATTLSYGASVTVKAQAKASSSATAKTDVASRTITAPADNKGTGWTLAVGKVSLPGSGTAATMSVVTPGSTYNTSGSTTYTVSADNNYAYIKQGTTTVARASHSAYSNGETAAKAAVTLTGSWSGSTYTVTNSANTRTSATTISFSPAANTIDSFNSSHKATATVGGSGASGALKTWTVDATSEYNAGWLAGYAAAVGVVGRNVNVITVPAASSTVGTTASSTYTITAGVTLNTSSPAQGYAHADATGRAYIDGTQVQTSYKQNNWRTT